MKRDFDGIIERGLEILHRQLECVDAYQKRVPVEDMPYVPLSPQTLERVESMVRTALAAQRLDAYIAATMHKWPPAIVQIWMMRAEEKEARQTQNMLIPGN